MSKPSHRACITPLPIGPVGNPVMLRLPKALCKAKMLSRQSREGNACVAPNTSLRRERRDVLSGSARIYLQT